MKKINFLFLLTPLIYLSQVGINTQNPTETLDVNGTLRIRNISKVNSQSLAPVKDSIMVFEKGVVKRATANQIIKQVDISNFPSGINTDNQQITNFKYDLSTHKISLTLENGGTKEIDLSSLDDNGTDNQQLTLSDNKLTLEEGGTPISLSPYLDNTDDQQITNFKYDPSTHKISLTLEDGGTKEIDLSSLDDNGTDNQQLTLSGNKLTLEDGGKVIDLSKYIDNTDKQKADVFTLDKDTLKLSLENDGEGDKEIDLSKYLDNTDNQQITNFKYDPSTHKISLTLEDGGTKEIDLSSLDNKGTDDQQLKLSGNKLTLEEGGTPISLSTYLDNTDNQQIINFKYDPSAHKISLTLEDGGTKEIDLSSLDNKGTDNQQLKLSGNKLTLEEGGTPISLSPYLDNTDNQQITNFKYNPSTHKISLTLEDGGTKEIDLSSLDNKGTDDQQLTLSSNKLTLEDGGTPISLSPYLDNTDNQQITNFKYNPSTHKISLTLEDGGTKEIDLSSLDNKWTDDQQLTLNSNKLTLEEGGTPVSLSHYLDNTDDQQITNFKYDKATRQLSLKLENSEEKKTDLATVPVGGIIMWSGSIDNIPSGWTLCNGQNGTPDLTDRFIVGAGGSYSVGNTGGENKITLTKDQIPNLSGSVTVKKENVEYKDTQFRDSDSDGGKEFNAMQVDGHDHYIEPRGQDSNYHSRPGNGGSDLYIYYKNRNINKDASGTFQFNRSNQQQKPVENRPPYYALAFIMFVGN